MRRNSPVAALMVLIAVASLAGMASARTAARTDGGRSDGHGRPPADDEDRNQGPGRRDAVRMGKIRELYADLVAPTPTLVLTGQKSVRHIFAADVRGRVTPAGEFMDAEAVNEYFFGLATTPTSHVARVDLPSLVASGDKVAVEADIHFQRLDGSAFTLRQTGFFTFDRRDRVASFDLAILNLGAAVNPKSAAEREATIQGVCAVLTLGVGGQPPTCPDEYADFSDCVSFMHAKPYGTWDRANSDTVVCRQLHTLLTPFRPAMHCPHAGKTGGHACVEFPYESFFEKEY
jgi:hypothetical protein